MSTYTEAIQQGKESLQKGRSALTVDYPSSSIGPSRLASLKTKWNRDDKQSAVDHYILWGDTYRLQRDLHIPKKTVESWMALTEWWPELLEASKLRKQEELDARYTKLLHDTLDQLDDRVRLGDYKLDSKSKDLIRIPVPGKDLSSIANTIFDKRQLLRGDATMISSKKLDNVKDLEAKFLRIAQDLQGKNVVQIDDKLTHTEVEETKHYD